MPDPTTPLEERLADDDVTVDEITSFWRLAEDCMTLEDGWELSQALQYGKVRFVPNVGPVWK